jgi:Leucine-rich repeat (LRR) protein
MLLLSVLQEYKGRKASLQWNSLHKANNEIAQYLFIDSKNDTSEDWPLHILNILSLPDITACRDWADYSSASFNVWQFYMFV